MDNDAVAPAGAGDSFGDSTWGFRPKLYSDVPPGLIAILTYETAQLQNLRVALVFDTLFGGLPGTMNNPSDRANFTIKGDTVFVLTVRRNAQDVLRPNDVESPPSA